jgi:hypothetical protein
LLKSLRLLPLPALIHQERQAAEASDVLLLPQLSQRLSVPPTSLLKVMMKPGELSLG